MNRSFIRKHALVILCWAALTPAVSNGASFDCSRASTSVEVIVCADPTVSDLDDRYATLYSQYLEGASDRGAFKREALDWLRNVRDACESSDCLTDAYRARMATLEEASRLFTEAAQESPVSEPAEPELPESTALPSEADSSSPVYSAEPRYSVTPEPDDAQMAPMQSDRDAKTGTKDRSNGSFGFEISESQRHQFLVLGGWLFVATLGYLVFLGVTDRVVVFYDMRDAWWSISPLVFSLGGFFIAGTFSPPNETSFAALPIQKIIVGAGFIGAAIGGTRAIKNAIYYNQNFWIGLGVGIGKIIISVLLLVTAIGTFRNIFERRVRTREAILLFTVVMLVGFLWSALVNGERVYERRGWQPA